MQLISKIENLLIMIKHNKIRMKKSIHISSFIIGAGSIFDLSGNYFQSYCSKTNQEADYEAILNDWMIVSDDISKATNGVVRRNNKIANRKMRKAFRDEFKQRINNETRL